MDNVCRRVPVFLLILLGIVLGIATALLWYFGYVPYVRPMIPYAFAFAVVIFIVTAILKAKCGFTERAACERINMSQACVSLRIYSPLVLIAAAVFIVFVILHLASYFPFAVRAVLAFIGSISFWTMLLSFISMICCISQKHR